MVDKNKEIEFLGYRVVEFSFKISENFNPQDLKIIQEVQIGKTIPEENKKFAQIGLKINVKSEDKALRISLNLVGGFQGNPSMEQKLFNNFLEKNAPAILYPFARAFITSLTAQANIPPLILPIFNFSK